ncbi:13459_t:CDS:2 [Ambispora gerdemannii]|uniref:13459_t:CDS:1 n=1 Tax=Ambispora gerdemannii TaxID=144530 RepID=A0A9N9CCL2_9GLOM|nr:13459_t:CDS:2 [Ambispora gerdemannii]
MNLKEELPQALTHKDIQRLEQKLEDLASKLAKTKFDDNGNNSNSHDHEDENYSTAKTSLVIDLPILGNPNDTDSSLSVDDAKSPLAKLLNHTFPDTVVDLVNKIPTNLFKLPFNFGSPPMSTNITETKITTAPPSRELCRKLIEDYFQRFNVFIPILDRRKFIDNWCNKSKQSQLLVSATLAVAAARFSDDPSIQKNASKPGGVFYDAAKSLLDGLYDVPRIETCQALILLSYTQGSLDRLDTASLYTGMAVQMANVLRLSQNEPTMSLEDEEERRRVFYCIYCIDRWTTFVLGKPYMIDDVNINVPLPTLPSANRLTRYFFTALIKLSRILGQIWKFGYSSQPKATHSAWLDHATDHKSTLRQLRGSLAKWLQELPEDLQYQYLPSTDQRTLFQLASFTAFAGHINILFHTCLILLHQPYITHNAKASLNSFLSTGGIGKSKNSSVLHQGPVKTCLSAAITISDIAKVTRQQDKYSFNNFQYSIYGVFQSTVLELVIMNGSPEYSQNAKKAFNDSMEELRFIADHSTIFRLRDSVKELEGLVQITNGGSSSSGTDIMVPFRLAAHNNNPTYSMNNSTLNPSNKSAPVSSTNASSIEDKEMMVTDDFTKFDAAAIMNIADDINSSSHQQRLSTSSPIETHQQHQIPANTPQAWDDQSFFLTGDDDYFFGSSTAGVTSSNVVDGEGTAGTGVTDTTMLVDDEMLYSSTGGWNHG